MRHRLTDNRKENRMLKLCRSCLLTLSALALVLSRYSSAADAQSFLIPPAGRTLASMKLSACLTADKADSSFRYDRATDKLTLLTKPAASPAPISIALSDKDGCTFLAAPVPSADDIVVDGLGVAGIVVILKEAALTLTPHLPTTRETVTDSLT